MKKSKLKSIGVKSIHYFLNENGDNIVLLEDGYDQKKVNLLFKADYENIDLIKLISYESLTKRKNIDFKDLINKKGFFVINSSNKNKILINSIKNETYISNLIKKDLNLDDSNNFEIQIYNNFIDLVKVIGIYISDVIYAINSVANKNLNDKDLIGIIPTDVELIRFDLSNNRNFRNYDEFFSALNKYYNVMITSSIKSLYEKDKLNFIYKDDIAFINKSIELKNKYKVKIIENICKRNGKNIQNLHYDLKKIHLTYDLLRILGIIRQYAVHFTLSKNNNLNPNLLNVINIFFKNFRDKFTSLNQKNINILSEYFIDEFDLNDYFEYISKEKNKNLSLSIEKMSKNIMINLNDSFNVTKQSEGEFKNKFKNSLKYILYKDFESLKDKYLERLMISEDKDKTYEKISNDIINSNLVNFDLLEKIIIKYLGTNKGPVVNEKLIDFKVNNDFFKYLYIMSLFLSKKEANSFYSDVLNKYKSIIGLINLANESRFIFKDDSPLFKFFNKNKDVFDFNQSINSSKYNDKLIEELHLLKSLRSKEGKDVKYKFNDLEFFYESLEHSNVDYNKYKDSNKKSLFSKLKKHFSKNILQSKYYQYISNYVTGNFLLSLFKNKTLIKFALTNIYESDKEMLSNFYNDFYNSYLKIEEGDVRGTWNENKINSLCDFLCNLTLINVNKSLINPQKTEFNYIGILKLYYFVGYLLIKNLVKINSSYFIAYHDYELAYRKLHINFKKPLFDLSVAIDSFNFLKENKPNSKSFIQLNKIFRRKYIHSLFIDGNINNKEKEAYLSLLKEVRNRIEHINIFNYNFCDLNKITRISSYHDLYWQMLQLHLFEYFSNNEVLKELNNKFNINIKDSHHSTKLNIILFLPFAYNVGRFNNLTIEKYAGRKND